MSQILISSLLFHVICHAEPVVLVCQILVIVAMQIPFRPSFIMIMSSKLVMNNVLMENMKIQLLNSAAYAMEIVKHAKTLLPSV